MARKHTSIPSHVTERKGSGEELPDLESDHPDARVAVARTARERQLHKSRERRPRTFLVQFQGKEDRVEALDENEAWAKFCDARKEYPSPAGRVVTEVARKRDDDESDVVPAGLTAPSGPNANSGEAPKPGGIADI